MTGLTLGSRSRGELALSLSTLAHSDKIWMRHFCYWAWVRQIIQRCAGILRPSALSTSDSDGFLDLGQGAHLRVGEKPVLFLSEAAKRSGQPDAVAEVRAEGFYLNGRKIEPSHGSVLQPAMKIVQKRKNHRNSKGELISLSAWRQWHVVRDNNLIPIFELKDQKLARKRGRTTTLTTEELGL